MLSFRSLSQQISPSPLLKISAIHLNLTPSFPRSLHPLILLLLPKSLSLLHTPLSAISLIDNRLDLQKIRSLFDPTSPILHLTSLLLKILSSSLSIVGVSLPEDMCSTPLTPSLSFLHVPAYAVPWFKFDAREPCDGYHDAMFSKAKIVHSSTSLAPHRSSKAHKYPLPSDTKYFAIDNGYLGK